jgi:epoxyqueuosine reductase
MRLRWPEVERRDKSEDEPVARRSTPEDPRARVIAKAHELGFDAVGIARADEPLGVEHARYLDFVARGLHGTMRWLAEDSEARRSLAGEAILAGAKSVICVARRYARADDGADPPLAQLVARYARGQDYHNYLRKKLRLLAKLVRTLEPGARARPLLDEEPVLERAWAARAGLGFVGKHGLVIVPGQGSYVLLGEVVTTVALAPDAPMAERCGSCTRCLDACPTDAFERPFVLDPRRCIAYLTIEDRSAEPRLEPDVGEHLFGCDDCQAACPFNRTAPPPRDKTRIFEPQPRLAELDVEDALRLDEEAYLRLTTGSPLRRATRAGFARSAVRVLASRAARTDETGRRARAALEDAASHDDAAVRELARAALDRVVERATTRRA